MVIEQLISPIVPTLLPTDTGDRALHVMEETNLHQLPLVSDEQYVGLVREDEVLDTDTGAVLGDSELNRYRPAVYAGGHPFEAVRMAHQQNLSVVPVVDGENRYVGAITRDDLIKYIAENTGLDNPGGILVLEVDPRNYSLQEIARICEIEDVFIMSTQVFSNKTSGNLEITLKTNRSHLESVISSFERHKYHVKEVFGDTGNKEDLMDRYNSLMNYLNM